MFNLTKPTQPTRFRWALLLPVLLFISLALFPYGVAANHSRLIGFLAYRVFETQAAHIVGHFGLFLLMGTAVLTLIPALHRWPKTYGLLMLGLGFVQEILQLTTFKNRPFAFGEWFDLAVDMAGALAAWLLFRFFFRRFNDSAGIENNRE